MHSCLPVVSQLPRNSCSQIRKGSVLGSILVDVICCPQKDTFWLFNILQAEIQKVLELKVKPERIVYANPCKQNSHIRYAAKKGITMMTFDNEIELHKIKLNHPKAE